MKLNFGKRLVLFLHWLMSLAVCTLAVLWFIIPAVVSDIPEMFNRMLGAGMAEIAGIALAAVYVLLAALSVIFIFSRDKKRGDRGFITVDSSEAGRTRIAIGAVEQMIRQAVRSIDGIADMKSSIINGEDSISINTSVSILSGAHVPTVTMNIQRAIRSYIELNCGVAVREVSVSVHSLTGAEENGKNGRKKAIAASAPAAAVVNQMPAAEAVSAAQAQVISDDPREPLQDILETEAAPEVDPIDEKTEEITEATE